MGRLSVTFAGAWAALLGSILTLLGVEFNADQLLTWLTSGLTFLGGCVAIWGRFRRGDVSLVGIKRVPTPVSPADPLDRQAL